MTRWLRRIWFVLTRGRAEADLREEIEFHRQMTAAALRAQGVAESGIRTTTQRALGNDLTARQQSRDVWIPPWLQDIDQDARFAIRMARREPRFTLAAMFTLGLGIAVSNAAFTFVNAAIFRDLPFVSPERLITIRTDDVRGFQAGVAYPEFLEWQRHASVFETLSADLSQSVSVSDSRMAAERLSGTFVTAATFRMLGVAPIIGRDFVAEDDRDGAEPVVVLSHGLWVSRYGADTASVGRVIKVGGQPATIIGVMPERFAYPLVADLWLPMAQAPGLRSATWVSTAFGVVGRLRPGVSIEQARTEIEAIGARTARDHPEMNQKRKLVVLDVKSSTLGKGATQLMWALLGGAVIVLLIASANVANLMLARAAQRAREVAVRIAIGASRWRVVRQVLIECVLIGAGGSVVGGYLAVAGFQAMASGFNVLEFGAPDRPRKPYWFDPSVDGSGFVFMGSAFLLACLGAGLIPALQMAATDANQTLQDARDGNATRRSRRWAAALMAGQVAFASMLLVAGGLFARAFVSLYNTDPVIATENRVAMRLTLPAQYGSSEDRLRFVRRLDERLTNNPQFADSTIASDVPLNTLATLSRTVEVEGETPDPNQQPRRALYIAAGPRFFSMLAFPSVHGRALTVQDERRGTEGAVVNRRFADMFFGSGGAIGKRVRLTQPGPPPVPPPAWLTIVGVVPTVPDFLPNRPDDAVIYAPLLGDPTPSRGLAVIVRSDSTPVAVAALRHDVAQLDADLPVYAIQTLDDALAMTRMGARMVGSWFQALAVIAMALAAVGLYALTAHGMAQRTREIGIRMALGAEARQVVFLFARRTLLLIVVGLMLGVPAALLTSQLLSAFLGEVSPRDPMTFVAAAMLLCCIATLAGLWPARKASRLDPVQALRAD